MAKQYMNMMEQFTDTLKKAGNEVILNEGVLDFFKEKKPEIRQLDTPISSKEIGLIDSKYPWLIRASADILKQEAGYILKKRRDTNEDPTTNIKLKLESIRSSVPKDQFISDKLLDSVTERLASAVKYSTESSFSESLSFARNHVASAFKSVIDNIKRNSPSYMTVDNRTLNEADFSGIACAIICEAIEEGNKSRAPWKSHGKSYDKSGKRMVARLVANGRKRGVLTESAHIILKPLIKTKCACCSCHVDPDTSFKDSASLNEFKISGYCQECQDSIFE